MIKNYIKIAWRNLTRHKAFSVINITGLAIGIASCLLLYAVITYELSYDKFQPNFSRIYHVITEDRSASQVDYTPGIPFPAIDALRIDMPAIKIGSLMASFGSQVTVLGSNTTNSGVEKKFIESNGFFFADPQFFEVFQYEWAVGNPSMLKDPNTTVLTKKMAEKYFGDWKLATGKLLKLDNSITTKIVGILNDLPQNTDFPLGIVSSLETAKNSNGAYFYSTEWGSTTSNFQGFILLPENISSNQVNTQLLSFSKKHYKDNKPNQRQHMLQPLSQLHFDKRVSSFGDHITDKATLWTLSLIAVFIILMACINFINLSTAQAVGRGREIGIRKVLGSHRKQLFAQVMAETASIVIISVVIAVGLSWISIPYINHITSISQPLDIFNWQSLLFILLLIIVVTLLSGFYPAMILSGYNPSLALKNKIISASVSGISVRRGLVITQFAISQILIIGTIVAVTQMNFVKDADLGFAKESLMIIRANTDSIAQSRQKAFASQLTAIPGIDAVSFSSDVPSSDNNWTTNFAFNHKPDEDFSLYIKCGDEQYFKTYGLKFISGKPFTPSDTVKDVVINETLVKKLNLGSAEQAIGKEIRMGRQPWKTIVGVVKDFKTNSLKEDVKPTIIAQRRNFYSVTGIKLRTNDIAQTKKRIESAWDRTFPEYAYTTAYMDENIDEFYKQDEQLALLYKIFAGIAIFISCIGLYGLVSYMAVQRTKEIGIRKVLGASISNIIYLFSKEFTVLILIGSFIAIPVAYYMMNEWLKDFVFRIKLSPVVFIIAIASSIVVAWVAVGYRSIKAALANPVKSIRTE